MYFVAPPTLQEKVLSARDLQELKSWTLALVQASLQVSLAGNFSFAVAVVTRVVIRGMVKCIFNCFEV